MTDTTQTPAAPAPGTAEHDAAMVAAFDKSQTSDTPSAKPPVPGAPEVPAPAAPTVPEWVPEEFRSAADPMKAMADAYAALKTPPKVDPAAAPAPSAEDAAKALEGTGIDYASLEAKFAEKGALEATDYEALSKVGIPKEAVDAFIAGQQASADVIRLQVVSTVGGEETYTAMAKWAGANLPKAEVEAFNKVTDTGSIEQIKLAVQGLHARYTAANGVEPKLLGGDNQPSAGEVFRSTAELTAAIRDPRYKTDPAYRMDVEKRLDRSNIL